MKGTRASRKNLRLPREAGPGKIAVIVLSFALFLLARLLRLEEPGPVILTAAAAVILCLDLLYEAARKLLTRGAVEEELLFTLATAGSFALKIGAEGTAALLIYRAGALIAALVATLSEGRMEQGVRESAPTVRRVGKGRLERVYLDAVRQGDVLRFDQGETVPLRGKVAEGAAQVSLPGEEGYVPWHVREGDPVPPGSVVLEGTLYLCAEEDRPESAPRMNWEGATPMKTGRLTFFARFYAPIILALALVVGILVPLLGQGDFAPWMKRALGMLVTASQSALAFAVPLAYFAGVTAAFWRGVLFRSFGAVDTLSRTTSAAVDIETLVTGRHISHIRSDKLTREQVILLAAYAGAYADGASAEVVRRAYGEKPDALRITEYTALDGGVQARIGDLTVVMGSAGCLKEKGVEFLAESLPGTETAYIAVNGQYAGEIGFTDALRSDALPFVRAMAERGVDRVVLLSKGEEAACAEVAGRLGIGEFYAELKGEERTRRLKVLHDMQIKGEKMAYIAREAGEIPLMRAGDVGIAPGGAQEAVKAAADVVLQSDYLPDIAQAVAAARNIRLTAMSLILVPVAVKVLMALAALLFTLPMWAVTLADFLLTLAALAFALSVRKRLVDGKGGLFARLWEKLGA